MFIVFLCFVDMESFSGDSDVCVKISSGRTEPQLLFRLACGNRSQNFIDEVFRAVSCKSINSLLYLNLFQFHLVINY